MTKIWTFIKDKLGFVIGLILCIGVIAWTYGCQSQVTSITEAPKLVTRAELEIEVDYFLEMAEIRFAELDKQDEFKRAIFAVATGLIEGGSFNPGAIALILGNILGLGAVIDNIRKRTVINTLKGVNTNAEEKTKA